VGRHYSLSWSDPNTRLNWSPHIHQVRKQTALRMGKLGPLLNRKSDLSVTNGVPLYRQLIRSMMDYACPAWWPMSGSYRCYNPSVFALLLVTPCTYQADTQGFRFTLFADHIRALTASFDSKLADAENPLVRQIGRYLRWPRVDPVAWRESQGRQGPAGQSRPSPAMAMSTKQIAFGGDQPSAFPLPWLRVFRDLIIIFINCNWLVTRWQWLFYMCTNMR